MINKAGLHLLGTISRPVSTTECVSIPDLPKYLGWSSDRGNGFLSPEIVNQQSSREKIVVRSIYRPPEISQIQRTPHPEASPDDVFLRSQFPVFTSLGAQPFDDCYHPGWDGMVGNPLRRNQK